MYENFHKLAAPCQSSVADLRSLRQQYWKEESMAHDGPDGSVFYLPGVFFVVFLFVCALLGFSCNRCLRKKIQSKRDNRALLAVIEADPALKAQCKSCLLLVLVD